MTARGPCRQVSLRAGRRRRRRLRKRCSGWLRGRSAALALHLGPGRRGYASLPSQEKHDILHRVHHPTAGCNSVPTLKWQEACEGSSEDLSVEACASRVWLFFFDDCYEACAHTMRREQLEERLRYASGRGPASQAASPNLRASSTKHAIPSRGVSSTSRQIVRFRIATSRTFQNCSWQTVLIKSALVTVLSSAMDFRLRLALATCDQQGNALRP